MSALPKGDRLNHLMQRRITGQFPRSDEHFRLHALETVEHWQAFRRHAPGVEPGTARFFEFGAGWDLITPIVYHGLGVGAQTLVDIRPNLRLDHLNWTIEQYGRLRQNIEREGSCSLRPIPTAPVESPADLERGFGITYVAPCDARATGFAQNSFHFASSTFTLEHIPPDDIAAILTEARRILGPDRLISSSIDMQDHYSYFDRTISAFNFLKFSDRTWRFVNSGLHYQNRLRAPDYRSLHEEAGLEIVEARHAPPSGSDLATIDELPLARRFRDHYEPDELAIRGVRIVARVPA